MKPITFIQPQELITFTQEEVERLMRHINDLFKKKGKEGPVAFLRNGSELCYRVLIKGHNKDASMTYYANNILSVPLLHAVMQRINAEGIWDVTLEKQESDSPYMNYYLVFAPKATEANAVSPVDLLMESVDQERVQQLIRKINEYSTNNSQGSIAVFGITHLSFGVPLFDLKDYSTDEMMAALIHFKQTGWDVELDEIYSGVEPTIYSILFSVFRKN